jgi:uncharacterized protein YdhG (YjbR/CyaY superfamily)
VTKPESVEAYVATLADDRRTRIEALRRTVRAAAPAADEVITYDMPGLKVGSRFLVSFAAYKRWDSLFPASRFVLDAIPEAQPYAKGRGTFQFPAAQPLPLDLIDRIVRVRVDELAREAG